MEKRSYEHLGLSRCLGIIARASRVQWHMAEAKPFRLTESVKAAG